MPKAPEPSSSEYAISFMGMGLYFSLTWICWSSVESLLALDETSVLARAFLHFRV